MQLPNNKVRIVIKDKNLVVSHTINGTTIAEHPISNEKGELFQNRNHLRNRSKQIEELKVQVLSHFRMNEQATSYKH